MNVNAAEAVRVAEDGDASIVLDVPDQFIGTTRYDKVDVFIEVKKGSYNVSSRDELNRGVRN